jgi:hypothetical protein
MTFIQNNSGNAVGFQTVTGGGEVKFCGQLYTNGTVGQTHVSVSSPVGQIEIDLDKPLESGETREVTKGNAIITISVIG